MGFMGRLGKRAATEVGYIVGWNGMRLWGQRLRTNWHALHRVCAACGKGRMYAFTEMINGESRRFYGCSSCDHYEVADLDRDDDLAKESLNELRVISAKRLSGVSSEDREAALNGLRSHSRAMYGLSVLVMLVGVAVFFLLDTPWGLLNGAALAVWVCVKGMVSSYRHWQLESNTFYQPGAFRRWLKEGQWLI